MAIRYDKKLDNEINRVIKNFNQKVARLEKQNRELLPSKISKKEIKAESFTRNELKRKLQELERFSKRGAEDIVTTSGNVRITKYELENLKREKRRIKTKIKHEISRLETSKVKIFGKEQITTFAQMGDQYYLNLKARYKAIDKNINKVSKDELTRFKKLLHKTGINQNYMELQFKENYFKMLTDLAYYNNYSEEKLDELKKKLYKLKPDEFLKLFRTDKSVEAILYYYPIVNGSVQGVNRSDIENDVTNLYDNLIDNIDAIISGVKNA